MLGREVPHEREKPKQATGCGGGVGVRVGCAEGAWYSEETGEGDSACAVVRENKFLKQVYLLMEEG